MRHKNVNQVILALALVLKLAVPDFAQSTPPVLPLEVLEVKPARLVDDKGRSQEIRLVIGLRSAKLGASPRKVFLHYRSMGASQWLTVECKYPVAKLRYSATVAYSDSTPFYLEAELRDGSRVSRFGDGIIDGTHLPTASRERDWPLAFGVGIIVFLIPFGGGRTSSTPPSKNQQTLLVAAAAGAGVVAGVTTYLYLRHKKRASQNSTPAAQVP